MLVPSSSKRLEHRCLSLASPCEDPVVFVTAGYLAPFCLHMAYLTCVSWSDKGEKKHRLMECSKLAEATLEASISALLSAYALAHHDIPQTIVYLGITQEMMVFASMIWSFATMGYTLMGFDCKEPGLDHLPGTADREEDSQMENCSCSEWRGPRKLLHGSQALHCSVCVLVAWSMCTLRTSGLNLGST